MAGKKSLPVPSADDLVSAEDSALSSGMVEVPEWGYSVKVRSLTRAETLKLDELGEIEAEVFALVNAVLEPKLSEDQAKLLLEKSQAAVGRIVKAVMERSGLVAGFRQG